MLREKYMNVKYVKRFTKLKLNFRGIFYPTIRSETIGEWTLNSNDLAHCVIDKK